MNVKNRLYQTIEQIPEEELPILSAAVCRFVPDDSDDVVTEDELKSHEIAIKEYENGEAVSIADIDWN